MVLNKDENRLSQIGGKGNSEDCSVRGIRFHAQCEYREDFCALHNRTRVGGLTIMAKVSLSRA